MTIESSIETALFTHMATLDVAPIAWPNRIFTPPAEAWLRVDHMRNRTERPFIGSTDSQWRQGILQVTAVAPLSQGPAAATSLAAAVVGHFPADLRLDHEGVRVRIQMAPSVLTPFRDAAAWHVATGVPYECWA